MQKFLLCFLAVLVVSSITIAQMKLQLPADVEEETKVSINKLVLNNSGVGSNSYLLAELPGDKSKIIPGSFMVGLLGDVTFPFGEEFKNYAGTAWSVHGFGGYVINPLILSLKVGYIRFGEVETDFGLLKKGAQYGEILKAYNTQMVIAAALAYLLSGINPTCVAGIAGGIMDPFIAVAICMIFKSYFQTLIYNQGLNKIAETAQLQSDFEDSSTIFGIVPSVGTFFHVSDDISLILSADYYYLFDKADEEIEGSSNINYLSLTFGGAYSF
jgi:hypothetical protein